ncbi:MAG: ferrochelatase [Burkholderiaceae bacterium]
MVHTRKQAALLRGLLGNDGYDVEVEFAMRYGEPAIGKVLAGLRDRSLRRLLVLPLYPQYAGSTTATVNDEIFRELAGWRDQPELRMVRGFCDDPGYIDALALSVERHWARNGRAERLLMSFHGVPRKTLDAGDPYHCECHKTARLLAQRLGLPDAAWQLVFQSRFGRAKWLEPYTSATLARLAKDGVKTVDVICPGFVSDCLETLEEIAIEARESFVAAGGEALRYIPCLNESDAFVAALGGLVKRHLSGWPVGGGLKRRRDEEQAAQETAMRARALGAKR